MTQDTFFNVWRRAPSYQSKRGTFRAWLFSIAHHRAIDEIGKRKRDRVVVQYEVDLENRPADDSTDPVKYTNPRCNLGKVKEALSELRTEQRKVV